MSGQSKFSILLASVIGSKDGHVIQTEPIGICPWNYHKDIGREKLSF